jgi:hypothetical protein
MIQQTRARLLLSIGLVALCTAMRIGPHPWNLTPAGAIALFCGASFDRKRWALLVPLASMFVSDTVLELTTGHGYHSLMPVVYATFAAITVLGMLLRSRRHSPLAVVGGATGSATLFYVVTNFAVWTISTTYPNTLAGLAACYIAAIPFYGTMLAGDLLYATLLFGTFVRLERRVPRFAATAQ